MALLSDVAVIFWSSIVVLTPNRQYLGCATIAFSEQYIVTRRLTSQSTYTKTNLQMQF